MDHCSHTPCEICDRELSRLQAELDRRDEWREDVDKRLGDQNERIAYLTAERDALRAESEATVLRMMQQEKLAFTRGHELQALRARRDGTRAARADGGADAVRPLRVRGVGVITAGSGAVIQPPYSLGSRRNALVARRSARLIRDRYPHCIANEQGWNRMIDGWTHQLNQSRRWWHCFTDWIWR